MTKGMWVCTEAPSALLRCRKINWCQACQLEYCNVDVHHAKVSLPSCMHDCCTDNPSSFRWQLGIHAMQRLHIVLWHYMSFCCVLGHHWQQVTTHTVRTSVGMYDRTYLTLADLTCVKCHSTSAAAAVAQRGRTYTVFAACKVSSC